MTDIGFIGLGIMGRPMAGHLQAAGHRLFLHDIAALPNDLVAAGAVACDTAKDVAQKAEIVILMVPDTPHVDAALFGRNGVAEGLAKGKIVVDMSSISPLATKEFARRINALGADYLDAPVSGGESGAIEGTLAIMVGGDEAAFNRARPLFELMGKRVTHMGPVGAGQTTKLANQIAVAVTLEAAAEALLFARAGGLDADRVIEAIGAGAAGSWQLNNLGPKIVARDFRPGFFVQLMRKDLRLVTESAQGQGLALPGLALMTSMFNATSALGHDRDGTQAVADALDRVAVKK